MTENWIPSENQGKRKEQIEDSYRITGVCFIVGIIAIIILSIF